MQTLDQAIQNRIEAKRRAREEAVQQQREQLAKIARQENAVAEQVRTILEAHYGFSLERITIKAIFQVANYDDPCFFNLRLEFPGEYAPHCVVINSAFSINNIETCLIEAQWAALHVVNSAKDCKRSTFYDLLEAIMFARFGTTDPEEASIMAAEGF
jgi:hypothetical protein